jgi:nucleoside-triphosphatase THEP1
MRKAQKNRNDDASCGLFIRSSAGISVGWGKELAEVLMSVKNRKSLHIYGPGGTGKSALLEWLCDNWQATGNELIPIYCRSSRTLRQILLYVAAFLLDHFKHLESIDKFKQVKEIRYAADIKKLSIRALRNIVYAYIPQDNFCLILDHLEYVTPKINGFLTVLYEKALVITASKQSWELTDYGFKGNLAYCLYLTPKLKLSNLPKEDAYLLMEHLWRRFHMDLPDKTRLFREIFLVASGNPKLIVEIMSRAGREKYWRSGECNFGLIHLDMMIETPLEPRRTRATRTI